MVYSIPAFFLQGAGNGPAAAAALMALTSIVRGAAGGLEFSMTSLYVDAFLVCVP